MNNFLEKIFGNPISAIIVGLLLFIFVPGLRIYIAVITAIVFIVYTGKNGITIYLGYSSLGAFLSFVLSFLNEGTNAFQQVDAMVSLLTIATIGNIIDLLFYVESSGWNRFENFIACLCFGFLALFINKFS